MSTYHSGYSDVLVVPALEACQHLELDPWVSVDATDQHGNPGTVPRWMVVAEEMRRFAVYSRMAKEAPRV